MRVVTIDERTEKIVFQAIMSINKADEWINKFDGEQLSKIDSAPYYAVKMDNSNDYTTHIIAYG